MDSTPQDTQWVLNGFGNLHIYYTSETLGLQNENEEKFGAMDLI